MKGWRAALGNGAEGRAGKEGAIVEVKVNVGWDSKHTNKPTSQRQTDSVLLTGACPGQLCMSKM